MGGGGGVGNLAIRTIQAEGDNQSAALLQEEIFSEKSLPGLPEMGASLGL